MIGRLHGEVDGVNDEIKGGIRKIRHTVERQSTKQQSSQPHALTHYHDITHEAKAHAPTPCPLRHNT